MQTTRLTDLLPVEHIVVPLRATTLGEAIGELLAQLAHGGVILAPDRVRRALTDGRVRAIIAITPDVALPHFRTTEVERLTLALGVAPQPLEAGDIAFHGQPRIVALALAPPDAATLYLKTVSALAGLFREPAVVDRIAAARSPAAVLAIAELADLQIQPRLTVRDIMTHMDAGVMPSMPVRDAVDLMVRHRLRALPVVGEKQEVLGIISEWDIMRGLLPQIPRATDTSVSPGGGVDLRVRDLMTRSVLCVSEDLGLDEAANMMINKDVEQFPVTSEGKLTGFLTRGDIIRKLFGRPIDYRS